MIEQAIVTYLNRTPAVTSVLGGEKVYYGRAPSTVKMPYVTVRNSGGMRERITHHYTDTEDTLTIYVDAAADKQFIGRDIAEAVKNALENYRGDMYPEEDLNIRCGSIRDLDGYQSSFRYIVTAYVRYKEVTAFPV